MNEQELERRFRSVTEGQQPNAPQSLRHFLYSMPETVPAKRPNVFVRLARSISMPAAPRLAGAGIVAFAVVAALFAANFVMSIRQNTPAQPSSPAPSPTALRSFVAAGIEWTGTTELTGPVPIQAVTGGPLGYMGVGESASGHDVLLDSRDGINWIQRAAADAPDTELRAIAHKPGGGFVLVGGTDRAQAFSSKDGETWTPASAIEAPDVVVRNVVANKLGFVAVGWADAAQRQTYVWTSEDGTSWKGGPYSVPLTGPAWIRAEEDTFLISATPLEGNSAHMTESYIPVYSATSLDELWKVMLNAASPDLKGVTILGAVKADNADAAVPSPREIFLVRRAAGQNATQVLQPTNWDTMNNWWDKWGVFQPKMGDGRDQNDLTSIEMVGKVIVGVDSHGGVYTSTDVGLTWSSVPLDTSNGPAGTRIVPLGNGKVLVTGEQQGVWIGSPLK